MTERDEREEEPVGAESDELIRAHAELKKLVRTGEDLLYWNHTSGQRPLTRDERKDRREARRGSAEPVSPIWHDTDLDPRADITESHPAGRGKANPPAGEQAVLRGVGVQDRAFDTVLTEPLDREESVPVDVPDETPTRVLEEALEHPLSGLWRQFRRARVAVAAAAITIVVGGLITYLAAGSRQPAPTAPTARAIEATERRVAPVTAATSSPAGVQAREPASPKTAIAPAFPEPVAAGATAAGTVTSLGATNPQERAPVTSPSAPEAGGVASSKALVEHAPRAAPRRSIQAPKGSRSPSSTRPDLPGNVDLAAPVPPPTALPPADHDSAGNPDYELLVPEIRRP